MQYKTKKPKAVLPESGWEKVQKLRQKSAILDKKVPKLLNGSLKK